MKVQLLTATLLATTCLPAFAAGPEAIVEESSIAALPEAQSWQGLHFGIAASIPNGDNFWGERGSSRESSADDYSGTLPTISAGHDWQNGGLVYGVKLFVSGGDLTAEPFDSAEFGCSDCKTTVDNLASLLGRVGWSFGKTLVYATAGAARADVVASDLGGSLVSGDDSLTGWVVGVGAEHYVAPKITVFVEYLQTDLGRLELPDNCAVSCYTDIEFGLLHLGVNYRW